MSALRDLAMFIKALTPESPQVQQPKKLLVWLRARAITAIAEDDQLHENAARYRTGGSDTPSNPCLVYLKGTAPDPDTYMFALPSGLLATMVVDALNAVPPTP